MILFFIFCFIALCTSCCDDCPDSSIVITILKAKIFQSDPCPSDYVAVVDYFGVSGHHEVEVHAVNEDNEEYGTWGTGSNEFQCWNSTERFVSQTSIAYVEVR
eukprot:TRINITY_DN2651_c0_g1_i11.p1 TRINITY_DN2651_c0_g1~~TRINITY_DN2651_c0_g1_i11.p1  ORF type:complete len:103 (-),score=7.59 TRINITY_DN2651_c0_g1_i11:33-341(-)